MSRPLQRKVSRAYISYDPASDQSAILFKDRLLFPSGFRTTLRQGSKHALQIRDVLKNAVSNHSSGDLGIELTAIAANSKQIQEDFQEAISAERAEHRAKQVEHLTKRFHEHRDDLSAGPSIFLGETASPAEIYHVIGETSRWLDIFGEPGSGYSGLLSVLVRSQLYSRPGLMILDVSISNNLARVILPGRQSLVLTIEQALKEVRCYQREFDIKTRPIVLVSSPPHEPDDKNSMSHWNTLWKSSPDVVHMEHNTGVIAWDTWSRAAMSAFFSGPGPRFRSTLQYVPGSNRGLLNYSGASSSVITPTLNAEMMTHYGKNREEEWCAPEDVPATSEQYKPDRTAQEKILLDGQGDQYATDGTPDVSTKIAISAAVAELNGVKSSLVDDTLVSLAFESPEDLYRRFWEQDLPRASVLLGSTEDGQNLVHDFSDAEGELRISGQAGVAMAIGHHVIGKLSSDGIPVVILDPIRNNIKFIIPEQGRREMELRSGLNYLQFLMSQVPKGKKADLVLSWIDSDVDSCDADSRVAAERIQEVRSVVDSFMDRVPRMSIHLSEDSISPTPQDVHAGVTVLTTYGISEAENLSDGISGVSCWSVDENENLIESALLIPPRSVRGS